MLDGSGLPDLVTYKLNVAAIVPSEQSGPAAIGTPLPSSDPPVLQSVDVGFVVPDVTAEPRNHFAWVSAIRKFDPSV